MTSPLQVRVYNHRNLTAQVLIDKPTIRIGRGSDCEISLPDPTASATHCILRRKEDGWILEDTSKNGLQSESGSPLPQRFKVDCPQRIKLGRLFSLELNPQPLVARSPERTLIISEQPTQMVKFDGTKIVTARAVLKGVHSDGTAFARAIEAGGLSIGSHPTNDLVIASDKISQFHSRIEFSQNEFVLSDLASTNGTLLNGVKILQAILTPGAMIQLGETQITFATENKETEITPKSETEFMGLVSADKEMRRIFSICEVASATDAPIFIHGETGTGKELLAKAIHDLSPRFGESFVALNCAALPKDLIESELFGHEKGSFTGAALQRIGAFEAAHGGTLFLDEVAELDLNLQAKLLRALESGEVKRVGAVKPLHVSVRIVSATHLDLAREVELGKFRQDLFYRLHVVPIEIPALRERISDLALLIPQLRKQLKLNFTLEADALEALSDYDFPGNIRELKNILQRAAIEYEVNLLARRDSKVLTIGHFRFLDELKTYRPARTSTEMSERERIQRTLDEVHNNQSEAARRMQMPISTFHDRLKRYGLWKKDRQENQSPPSASVA